MLFDDGPLFGEVVAAVPPELCERLVTTGAREGFVATNNPLYRDTDRAMWDDPELRGALEPHVLGHLPATLGPYALVGLNERMRVLRYTGAHHFAEHKDHWYVRDENELSLVTTLVYLNDGYEGGETRMSDPRVDALITPATGMLLWFQHKLDHVGERVRSGTKYVLRTEGMYRRV
jgi:hypothetical protein